MKKAANENEVWVMPTWMEPYRDLFQNTGGNPIEELMNDHDVNMFSNSVRYLLMASVSAQVDLLFRMARKGLLLGVNQSEVDES